MYVGIFLFVMVLYVLFAAFVLYFFVIADPEQSPTAKYVTTKLPKQIWDKLSYMVGKRNMKFLQFVSDRLLIILYCAVVFGSWDIIFFYVYPWVNRQSYVGKYHLWIGYVVFASCVVSWRLGSTTSPGIITTQTVHRYDHFPYDNLLFVPGQTCKIRKNVPKVARSKYDRFKYCQNVPRFDHFCGWIYNTVGEENYRYFLLFLFIHVLMCTYGATIVGMLFYGEMLDGDFHQNMTFVDRYTGEEFPASKWIIGQYLFNMFLLEAAVFLLMAVMAIALGAFLGYHIYLTSFGMTTNEAYKWGQVKKWYKRELKRYNDALKRGQPVINESGSVENNNKNKKKKKRVVVTDDGDVTCNPAQSAADQVITVVVAAEGDDDDDDYDDPNIIRHPGPEPKNLYNRGFIENWKEVIFPISLRNDRTIDWEISSSSSSSGSEAAKKTS